MKKMLISAGILFLSGVWYAQMYAAPEREKTPVAEEVTDSNDVEYTVWRDENASEGYENTYLIDFYNNTDRQVYIEYDYNMKSEERWILRNSFHIGPKSSARNYSAGDVGEVRVRWQYEDCYENTEDIAAPDSGGSDPAAGYATVKVKRAWQDSCKKCNISDVNRACGECGGFLNSTYEGQDDDYMYYRYTCKECSHSCLERIKF